MGEIMAKAIFWTAALIFSGALSPDLLAKEGEKPSSPSRNVVPTVAEDGDDDEVQAINLAPIRKPIIKTSIPLNPILGREPEGQLDIARPKQAASKPSQPISVPVVEKKSIPFLEVKNATSLDSLAAKDFRPMEKIKKIESCRVIDADIDVYADQKEKLSELCGKELGQGCGKKGEKIKYSDFICLRKIVNRSTREGNPLDGTKCAKFISDLKTVPNASSTPSGQKLFKEYFMEVNSVCLAYAPEHCGKNSMGMMEFSDFQCLWEKVNGSESSSLGVTACGAYLKSLKRKFSPKVEAPAVEATGTAQ